MLLRSVFTLVFLYSANYARQRLPDFLKRKGFSKNHKKLISIIGWVCPLFGKVSVEFISHCTAKLLFSICFIRRFQKAFVFTLCGFIPFSSMFVSTIWCLCGRIRFFCCYRYSAFFKFAILRKCLFIRSSLLPQDIHLNHSTDHLLSVLVFGFFSWTVDDISVET